MVKELALIFAFASVVLVFDTNFNDYASGCDPAFFQGIQTADVIRCVSGPQSSQRTAYTISHQMQSAPDAVENSRFAR